MAMDKVYKKTRISLMRSTALQEKANKSRPVPSLLPMPLLDRKLLYQHTGNTKTTPEQLSTAYQNIRKTGRFMAFDLRHWGKDLFQNVIDSITEFAFWDVNAAPVV